MSKGVVFMAGWAFALNLQGLWEDIVGRDHVLAYVNNPANWTDSRISAPIHVAFIVASLVIVWWKR